MNFATVFCTFDAMVVFIHYFNSRLTKVQELIIHSQKKVASRAVLSRVKYTVGNTIKLKRT